MNANLTNSLAATMLAALVGAPIGAQSSVPDQVVSAMAKARADNMRILLVCGDDGIREQLSGELSRLILYEYVTVELPTDNPYAQAYKTEGINGGAFLVILDDHYKHLATKAVAELSDAAKTEAFLTAHQAEYLDAHDVIAKAQSLAQKTNRRIFVHLGAPW